ncbi:uncharacterized protein LOC129251348 [Anastrepha obliqua]|uniref:uncharacterized protein LOC129251348 n=1 Tax=Anastrepha obliqua TaxID=95512 RepID=UPI002409689B|nr:uncharacterized protein LOC129251348 [Anastrepha obliqua]
MPFTLLIYSTTKKQIRELSTQASALCTSSKRLFIHDLLYVHDFLIDSGADHLILKLKELDAVTTINSIQRSTHITTSQTDRRYKHMVNICLGLRREFSWNFSIVDCSLSIIGADFLNEYGFLADIKRKLVIDPLTGASSEGDDFTSERANVTHFIETTRPPVTAKARRSSLDELKIAKKKFNELLELAICRPSKPNYASPLHMVLKANGDWRPCVDYRQLNSHTKTDKNPILHLQNFPNILYGKRIATSTYFKS